MLDQITPLILTYNEAPNIGRNLERLRWARDIVVLDSFSDDATLEIVSQFSQARVIQRKFDTHANQWGFGLIETEIATPWVLALDADYILSQELINEIRNTNLPHDVAGWRAHFRYCINGRRLRSGVYPPVVVLYRRDAARYIQDGHTHRVVVNGAIRDLKSPILHDDRKPLRRWFQSQQTYAKLEAGKLLAQPWQNLTWHDRLRRLRIAAPLLMLFYCLICRGGIFDGWFGFYYALQRVIAEAMLAVQLIETDFRDQTSEDTRLGVSANSEFRIANTAESPAAPAAVEHVAQM